MCWKLSERNGVVNEECLLPLLLAN